MIRHPEFPDVTVPRCWGKQKSNWGGPEYRLYMMPFNGTLVLVEYWPPHATKTLKVYVGGAYGVPPRDMTHSELRRDYMRVSWQMLASASRLRMQQQFIHVMGIGAAAFPSLFLAAGSQSRTGN